MTCRCADSTGGNNDDDGNNCRTCSGSGGGGGVKLFGVRLTDGSTMKKSASVGDLVCESSCLGLNHVADGYHSDTPANVTNRRKKAVAWTEKEHQLFLKGLHKLGKGNWRGISKKFVVSRTPTQVASHAQKYFFRHSDLNQRKKRASLFDTPIDEEPLATEGDSPVPPQVQETDNTESLNLSLKPIKSTYKKTSSVSQQSVQRSSNIPPLAPKSQQSVQPSNNIPPLAPQFFYTGYIPVTIPFWPQFTVPTEEKWSHPQVLKPCPHRPVQQFNVDGLAGLAHLNLEKTDRAYKENSSSAFNSPGESRQSAFRTNESATQGGNQFELGKGNLFFI